MLIPNFARSVALAALLAPSIGFAQSATTSLPSTPATAPTTASPSAAHPATPVPSATTQAAVDQRIRALQSQLGITDAQMPLWNAFSQAMRDNAASTDALFSQRDRPVFFVDGVVARSPLLPGLLALDNLASDQVGDDAVDFVKDSV